MEVSVVEAVAPLLMLSILIERLLEVVFILIESVWIRNPNDPSYIRKKVIYTLFIGGVIGVWLAATAQLNFFPAFESPIGGILATGIVGGAISPYAHQIVEVLTKAQKQLDPANDHPQVVAVGGRQHLQIKADQQTITVDKVENHNPTNDGFDTEPLRPMTAEHESSSDRSKAFGIRVGHAEPR
ncbi:hypothetical protein G4Y79_16520 [Phototrophicus methaneseepsis]|uniref:Uncharacterized protein n=1 Tax=Phototrophicus methaneseepsis TaxID=2710758 RepID=A0A7S8IC94_9CHLR|nr:hypothetical protein [Phototrophicus methaneseepsis]QPC81300.1 hypothetical protein G4Y79_16520 [Phototrophicus methaneseepsis]